jgi:hypothetical protein
VNETAKHPFTEFNREYCERLGAGRCPFCGGPPSISGYSGGFWNISCKACYASTGQQHTDTEAVAAWNRRPDKLSKTKDRWITNAANHEVGDVMAILTRGQHGRVLRVGDPEPTSFYTVEALRKMGVVGIYEVLT